MIPDVRLIDADATKEKLGFAIEPFIGSAADEIRNDTLLKAIAIVDSMPTVDAQPVKHGHWVDYGSGVGMYCSECRHRIRYRNGIRETTKFSDGEFEFVQYASKNGYYYFCPKCGAKMDGDG